MRDAFGGAFMLKLALVFIIIYVSFMAIAIHYAKAFRVKNQIINIVEQYQYTGNNNANDSAITAINDYLTDIHYNYSNNGNYLKSKCDSIAGAGNSYTYLEKGVCIIPQGGNIGNFGNSSRYYKIVTFINIDFNFFNFHMTIPINGETKVIYINS